MALTLTFSIFPHDQSYTYYLTNSICRQESSLDGSVIYYKIIGDSVATYSLGKSELSCEKSLMNISDISPGWMSSNQSDELVKTHETFVYSGHDVSVYFLKSSHSGKLEDELAIRQLRVESLLPDSVMKADNPLLKLLPFYNWIDNSEEDLPRFVLEEKSIISNHILYKVSNIERIALPKTAIRQWNTEISACD